MALIEAGYKANCTSQIWTQGGTIYKSYVQLGYFSNVLGGNFPCTELNACNAGHDFILHIYLFIALVTGFLCSMRVFVCSVCACVGVWICVYQSERKSERETIFIHAFTCVNMSAWRTGVCAYMSRLIHSREHTEFGSVCRSGHAAWIDPVAAVQASDWGSPY